MGSRVRGEGDPPGRRAYDETEEFPWPVISKAAEIGLYAPEFYMERSPETPPG